MAVPVPAGALGAGAVVVAVPPLEPPLEPAPAVVVAELVLVLEELVEVAALPVAAELGTVNAGAPAVSVVPEPPLPQAATAVLSTSAAPSVNADLSSVARDTISPSARGLRSRAAPSACRSRGSR